MDTIEAIKALNTLLLCYGNQQVKDALQLAISALERQIEIPFYDQEEIHENCTVQVLKNTKTGAVSVGWWENGKGEEE